MSTILSPIVGNDLNFTTLQSSFQALSLSDYLQNAELIELNFKVMKTLSELNVLAIEDIKKLSNRKKAINRGTKRPNTYGNIYDGIRISLTTN